MSSILGITSNEEIAALYKTISHLKANALSGIDFHEELESLAPQIEKITPIVDKIVNLSVSSRITFNEIVQIQKNLSALSKHYSPIYSENLTTPEIDKVHKSVLPLIYEIVSDSDSLKQDLKALLLNVATCPKTADPAELATLTSDVEKICSLLPNSPLATQLKKCLPQ
jgi:hypothetical protein